MIFKRSRLAENIGISSCLSYFLGALASVTTKRPCFASPIFSSLFSSQHLSSTLVSLLNLASGSRESNNISMLQLKREKKEKSGRRKEENLMGWLPCSDTSTVNSNGRVTKVRGQLPSSQNPSPARLKSDVSLNSRESSRHKRSTHPSITAKPFSFQELATATGNFREESLLGEGGFGKVYRGLLANSKKIVAIKQLNQDGLQGNREFIVEVLVLNLLNHPNLVKLIGYCADGDQRLLVYEYMSLGSLEDHLHYPTPEMQPLDWHTRMKIAAGAAKGLEYLHEKANPPIIYRDLKCSNILLGEGYYPKLSDFGLAKLGPVGDNTHVSTRVMGTYGYCAPEYVMTGQLTMKSDIYSFGVVLLELITGRKAIDTSKATKEQNLVTWAKPLLRDRKKFAQLADPMLQGQYPLRGLLQALSVAAMCVQDIPEIRPSTVDVVTALTYLASRKSSEH